METTGSDADYSAALPLEIDEATAIEADNLLREYAEAAILETAIVVDRSGALVAGISSEENVTIDVISALVAGASGAMRALVSRLGESGSIESLHLGEDRLIYLKEVREGFILVAVADTARPAALVRQAAISIEPRLSEILGNVTPSPQLLTRAEPKLRYHAIVPRTSAPEPESEEDTLPLPIDPIETDPGGSFADLDLQGEVSGGAEPEAEAPQLEIPEPSEVHEPLLDEEPEIVVEPSFGAKLPVDSPFEAEEEEIEDEEIEEIEEIGPSLPAFEESLDEEDDLPLTLSPTVTQEPIFELDDDEEDDDEEGEEFDEDEADEEVSGEPEEEDDEARAEEPSGVVASETLETLVGEGDFNPFASEDEPAPRLGNVFRFADDEGEDRAYQKFAEEPHEIAVVPLRQNPFSDAAKWERESAAPPKAAHHEVESLFPRLEEEEEEVRSSGPFYF